MPYQIDNRILKKDLQKGLLEIFEESAKFNYKNGNEIVPKIENLVVEFMDMRLLE